MSVIFNLESFELKKGSQLSLYSILYYIKPAPITITPIICKRVLLHEPKNAAEAEW